MSVNHLCITPALHTNLAWPSHYECKLSTSRQAPVLYNSMVIIIGLHEGQPAGVSVQMTTITTVLLSALMCCLGSTGGFQLDLVGLKSQISIRWNPAQFTCIICTLATGPLFFGKNCAFYSRIFMIVFTAWSLLFLFNFSFLTSDPVIQLSASTIFASYKNQWYAVVVEETYRWVVSSAVKLWLFSGFYCAGCNAMHGIAIAVPSVCLSVRFVYCDKIKWWTADILIPHKTAITLDFRHQHWLVGDALFPYKYSPKVTHPLRKTPTSTDFHL